MSRALDLTPWTRQQLSPDQLADVEAWARERGLRVNIGLSFRGWTCRIYPGAWGPGPLAEVYGLPKPLMAFRACVEQYEGKVPA